MALISKAASRAALRTVLALAALSTVGVAQAREYPIGTPHKQNGVEISAVYLQPVSMEPEGMMLKAANADVHLEADIRALADNANGFPEGTWVPYLGITYEVARVGGKTVKGHFMPMVANDGPHYGDNVKLDGPGKYTLKLTISAPAATGAAAFGRHVDKETGVAPWFKPFTASYDFVYAGTGKKGGY